jgi:hypothetical protein
MPFVTVPDDYEVKTGDLVQIRLGVGFVQPPLWLVARAVGNDWEFVSGVYENDDLILNLRRVAPEIEIIQAGAVPTVITGLLAAAALGFVYWLIVKDFKVWINGEDGGWGFETRPSPLSMLPLLLMLGIGALWLAKK